MESIGRQFVTGWINRDGCPCQTASTSTQCQSPSRYLSKKSRVRRIFYGKSNSVSMEQNLSSYFTSPFVCNIKSAVYMGFIYPSKDGHSLYAMSASLAHGSKGAVNGACWGRLELERNNILSKSGFNICKRCEGSASPGGISSGPCYTLLGANKAEMFPSLQQLASSSSLHGKSTFLSGFSRRSSKQLNSSSDEFSKPSSRWSSSPPSFLSTRASLQKADSDLLGASQPSGKSPSAARPTHGEIYPGRRSSSLGNAVLSKSIPEFSEDQEFTRKPNKASSDLPRSLDYPDSSDSYPIHLSEAPATGRIPYFKASSASYKAQVLHIAKAKSELAGDSPESPSSGKVPVSSTGKNVRAQTQKSFRKPKIKSDSFLGAQKANTGNAVPSEESLPGSSNSADSISQLSTPHRPLSDRSAQGASSVKTTTKFSSKTHLSRSPSNLTPVNSSSEERKDASLASELTTKRASSPSRGSRKDPGPVLSGGESLDRLHQQLEDQARDNSTKVILQKPLEPEEASRLRDRLKEQKHKSMQEIHRRLFQHRGSDGQGDEFSCALEPDTLILGEYIVHKKVGVGKYIGMKNEVPPGKEKPAKYIYIKYADGIAKLKAKQAQRLLYRYHLPGDNGRPPSLSKLKDPSLWEKRRNKGKIAVQRMVVNMMELYIHRLKQSRPPYSRDPVLIDEFAAQFPHKPTPDQLKAFSDVERDMTDRDLPMDRLICGDVGFGKTEVALRALFIAVAAGKQAMVLTPSTVLAKQHYETIRDRFASFPGVKVALLCRFQRDSERRDLVVGIHDGSLSIVVGTHSLLGNQIRYHNLGLLVIDEEQRFGVKQKEKITCLKTCVDVLTLSATPIPRTLYLAMSGFRDASLLTTPPPERRPIQTHLLEYDEELARDAIQFELDRGGQVFYVVPKVKGINELQESLQSQFPLVHVAIAHGKQSASALEDAMEKFCEGQSKILLCTNIIESGLDIHSVNTIIVEDVHFFGLAQLYQLRGRVGRAHREAHAYLFHPHKSLLTDEALERLVALQECCDLGQGYQLAERDMAIRGIGSLFGEQQSGDAAKIGTDLYFEMLLEGLSKVDSQRLPQVEYEDVQLELGVDIHIPSDYIESPQERAAVGKNSERAASESLRALMLFTNRLRDAHGREPASMEMLLKTLYVRRMAADLGIHRIRTLGTSIMMETNMTREAFEMISASMPSDSIRSSITFEPGCIEIQGLIGLPKERQMERIFCCLSEMIYSLPSFVKYM